MSGSGYAKSGEFTVYHFVRTVLLEGRWLNIERSLVSLDWEGLKVKTSEFVQLWILSEDKL